MENYQEKADVFESYLEIFVYFISKYLNLLKMRATSWYILVIDTYLAGIHHFYGHPANDKASCWKTLIVIPAPYPFTFNIFYLKLLRFLENKECKKNERI